MIRKVDDSISVAPQISVEDVAAIKAAGFTAIVNNRPDDEEAGQISGEAIREAALAAGLTYTAIPITHDRRALCRFREGGFGGLRKTPLPACREGLGVGARVCAPKRLIQLIAKTASGEASSPARRYTHPLIPSLSGRGNLGSISPIDG